MSRLRQFGVKIETGVEGSVAESRGSRLTSGCGTQASPILKTSGGNSHRPIRELELESRPMRGQQGRSEAAGGRQHIEPAGGSLLASLPPDIHVCRSGGATSRHLHKYKHTNTNRQTKILYGGKQPAARYSSLPCHKSHQKTQPTKNA